MHVHMHAEITTTTTTAQRGGRLSSPLRWLFVRHWTSAATSLPSTRAPVSPTREYGVHVGSEMQFMSASMSKEDPIRRSIIDKNTTFRTDIGISPWCEYPLFAAGRGTVEGLRYRLAGVLSKRSWQDRVKEWDLGGCRWLISLENRCFRRRTAVLTAIFCGSSVPKCVRFILRGAEPFSTSNIVPED